MLSIIGLRLVDQRVYEVLVEQSAMTVGELEVELGLGRRQLRPVLTSLRGKGLVSRSPGPPERFSAVAPDVALGVLFLEKESELKQARLFAGYLHDRYVEAVSRRQPAELVEVVHGAEAISRRVEQVMRSATHEVRFIDMPPYAEPPRALHPVERDLLQRGVRFRGIYDRRALELHDLRTDLEAGLALGEQARVISDAPMKMILADRRLGLIPLRSGSPTLTSAVVVHSSALLDALGSLFGNLWNQAIPLALTGTEPTLSGGVSADDARLLALLTTGLPDRSIAKQLGLSYRTFQRRLRRLMTALGAETRFQAGLRAAAKGWANYPPNE